MSSSRPVYSSEQGRICPTCRRPQAACRCGKKSAAAPTGDGIVRVSRATQGRRGKGVTIVSGVPLRGDALAEFARELKVACGAGGALKDGVIEIQGEHRDFLVQRLEAKGWKVKRAGG